MTRIQCSCLKCNFFRVGGKNCNVSWLEIAVVTAVIFLVILQLFLLPQLSSFTTTLIKTYLTVTVIWFSVGATTWTVHVVSGFPASAIAIPVTKLYVTAVSLWPGEIRSQFLNFRIIPVSSWHWPIVISGTGIGVLSVWIISGGRSVVPRIPGIIIPTGVAMKDITSISRVVTMKSWYCHKNVAQTILSTFCLQLFNLFFLTLQKECI